MIMAAKRVKKLDGRKKGDQISKLPDSIIHHILSFLPTIEAVRMSILSKRWRRMWYSVPALNFYQIHTNLWKERFDKFVDECLKHREIGMRYISDSSVTRFNLQMPHDADYTRVDKWLNFLVVKNKMEELDLLLRPLSRTGLTLHYRLPKAILKAQSLALLKLEGLKMESPLQVCLPFLKLLSLKDVGGLNDHSLEDLLANCPSLEKLVLQGCKDLSAPRVSSSSLKSSEVQLVPRQKIKIEAINLRSLLFTGAQYCRISLATTCAGLESLSLYNVEFLGRSLADYIFKHALESLTIGGSIGWNEVKNIRSPCLKNLIISQRLSKEAGAVKVDAVNLVSFTYKAHRMKKFCDISLNSPNLRVCNVKLTSQYRIYDTNWYVNLMRLLSDVSCSKNMCLDVYYEEALIIPNELRSICRSSLLAVEHLKVTTYSRLSKMSDLKDSLYWLSPSLKSLSMEQQKNGFHF